MITTITGDLFDSKEQYICHQTNCVTTKAAHLAYHMFKRFPYADIYTNRIKHDKPGTIIIRGDGDKQRLVINILGQYYPGKPQEMNAKIDSPKIREQYFYNCLVAISKIPDLKSIAFPDHIGCGLADGNWEHYLEMITRFEKYIYNKNETRVLIYKL